MKTLILISILAAASSEPPVAYAPSAPKECPVAYGPCPCRCPCDRTGQCTCGSYCSCQPATGQPCPGQTFTPIGYGWHKHSSGWYWHAQHGWYQAQVLQTIPYSAPGTGSYHAPFRAQPFAFGGYCGGGACPGGG